MTSTETNADARSAAVPAERSVKKRTYAVSNPTSASVASEPTACAKSARASSKARLYERRRSRVITGTTRPAKPSQITAGRSPRMPRKPSRTIAGASVIVPNTVASASRLRGSRSPETTPVASAKERLAAAAAIVNASANRTAPGDSARARPAAAGAIPRASERQKLLP